MKNGKKIFILVETFLGLMVFVLVMFMFLEKNEKKQEKISVIIQNSDDSQSLRMERYDDSIFIYHYNPNT